MKMYSDQRYELSKPIYIKNYIEGGSGVVTLLSPSGVSHTYYFKRPKNPSEFPDDVIFVYAVHQEHKLFYIGMLESGIFRLTRHSRFLNDTPIVKGVRYILKMANADIDTPMRIYHEGCCCRCGRKLTSDKSRLTGIGPKCAKQEMFCR